MTLEQNLFLAKRNLVDTIWKQANLEGVNITFPETQMIIDGFMIYYLALFSIILKV